MDGAPLDRAVAPNLFDVVLDPDLVLALILANLMSPRLWTLRDAVFAAVAVARDAVAADVTRIQRWMDHHFEHLAPSRIAELNGALDLDAEAERLGADGVAYALSRIRASLDARIARGTLAREAFPFALLESDEFPAYTYATVDEAAACRRLLRGGKHKPVGLTCCVDEAAIFAALALIAPSGSATDLALLASPAHYSVLTWSAAGTWWFYSKHDLFAATDWARLVAERYAGDAQRAFDDRLPYFDRIIGAAGAYSFASGETSLDGQHLGALLARIASFFDCRLAQLDRAAPPARPPSPGDDVGALLARVATANGAVAVREVVRTGALVDGHATALRALYALRTLDLPDLRPYLHAARRNARLATRGQPIDGVEHAVRVVAAIPGTESIFADAGRLAMPDETVRFATGSDRDRALLLHVLLEQALAKDDPPRARVETIVTAADSYVCAPGLCISVARMARVAAPEGTVLHRVADPA
jgi:hypothetical protein